MATQVQFRGGSSSEHNSFTGAAREVTVDTTKNTVVVHDGSTAGGHALATENNPSFTGNVLIGGTSGSPNIELKSTGVGEFSGSVTAGGTPASGANAGAKLDKNGTVIAARPSNSQKVWTGYKVGDATYTSAIYANGKAEFAGSVLIGGTLPSAPNIELNNGGAADFAGRVTSNSGFTGNGLSIFYRSTSTGNTPVLTINSDFAGTNTLAAVVKANGNGEFQGNVHAKRFKAETTGTGAVFQGTLNGTNTSLIYPDGSAEFAGSITAEDKIQSGGNPLLSTPQAGVVLRSAGIISVARASGSDIFSGFTTGSSVPTCTITSDANAYFAGEMGIGGTSGSPNIELRTNGSAHLLGSVNSTRDSDTSPCINVFKTGVTNPKIQLFAGGSAVFAGTITSGGTVLTSDQRFKENITPANPQLADIEALGAQLKNYDWNADAPSSNGTRQLGLIAQDVEAVCPGIVKTITRTKQGAELTPETTDEEGNVTPATYEEVDDSYKGISHDALIMKLLGAVAELSAEVAALKGV